jgi:glycosyltransferase involved in cell wall biosynthesis
MACGRAVVATEVGDVPDLVENGVTGFVVPLEDSAALTKSIESLVTNRELCRLMGVAGRAKAEDEFGVNRLISETLAAYQAVVWKNAHTWV